MKKRKIFIARIGMNAIVSDLQTTPNISVHKYEVIRNTVVIFIADFRSYAIIIIRRPMTI